MSRTWWSPLGKRNVRALDRARPPALSPRLEALEDRTLLATLVVGPPGGTFATIQAAVNAAALSGDTVLVNPGTYTEQVKITKSLTLQGNGAGVIIQAPTTLTPDNGQSSLVEIFGGGLTVNINNLTIQGPNPMITAGIFIAGGATANVTGTAINQINQGAANFGVQGVRGILVGSSAGGPGQATITNCIVTNYQKTGIVTGGTGTTVAITGTTVTGVGSMSPLAALTAQNGIQISAGTTAQLSNNTVSGNEFTGMNSGPDPTMNQQSVGIFNFSDGSSFTGNTVFGNDEGIFNANTGTTASTISGNTVENNRFQGIILTGGTATVSNNTITGNNIGVALRASSGDTLNALGTLVSNNIANNGNGGLTFAGGGIVLLKQTGATTMPVATAHFNRIVGNSVGLDNSRVAMAATVDATNNFWGSNAGPGGPGSDTVSGPVTFNPWLVLQVTASPDTLLEGEMATVVADLTMNNAGMDTSALGHLPDGTPVSFGATAGTIMPTMDFTAAGKAAAQFTAGTTAGAATVSATVDNQTSTATLTVIRPVPPPPPTATVGVFDPATQTWYLRGSNSAGPPAAGLFRFGTATSLPVSGDWTGTSADTIGVFDQNTFTWFLRNEDSAGPPDAGQFQYGAPGWLPVTGDWNNSGHTGIGAFDPATQTWYLRNEPNAGAPDAGQFRYGVAGGLPAAGDWTGTGHLGIGIFDPATATWYLRSSATAGPPDVGVFHFGGVGFKAIAGDWTGAGHAGIGAFDPSTATFFLRTEPAAGPPDAGQFAFGGQGFLPVAGLFPPATQLLLAAGGEGPGGAAPLSADQLQSAVAGALARLTAAGVDPGLIQSLGSARFAVGRLPDGVLGETDVAASQVLLSADATGHGWYTDGTPLADEEFAPGAPGSPLVALPGSPAAGKEDLLTAVLHEMGHLAGSPDGGTGLMAGALGLGTRNLGALDQVFAGPAARGFAL
jgi:parallel beta-helix repeat protein